MKKSNKTISVSRLTAQLDKNNSYVRSYGEEGKVVVSQRGQAIIQMLSFLKDDSTIKAHRRYVRKNKHCVSYMRFLQFVTAFRDIIGTPHGQTLIKILDTNPKVTYQAVLRNALAYRELLASASEMY